MVDVRYLTVYCLTFSPDGRSLLVSSVKRLGRPTGYEIHETQLWRIADGHVLSLPRLESVNFSGEMGGGQLRHIDLPDAEEEDQSLHRRDSPERDCRGRVGLVSGD
jgi:hypothetical protein